MLNYDKDSERTRHESSVIFLNQMNQMNQPKILNKNNSQCNIKKNEAQGFGLKKHLKLQSLVSYETSCLPQNPVS